VPNGVPCAVASAAFRGPRLVGFQREWAAAQLAFAKRLARRFLRHPAQSLAELEAVATEGLCKAAVRFVPGCREPRAYARAWVRRELHRHVTTETIGPVSRSFRVTLRARELEHTATQLAHTLLREPGLEEVRDVLPAPSPTQHGRRHPETLDELAALSAVFVRYTGLEDGHAVTDGPNVSLLPYLPPTVRAVVHGATIPEIARYCRSTPEDVEAGLMHELRKFF
jgi:hypothetical protein